MIPSSYTQQNQTPPEDSRSDTRPERVVSDFIPSAGSAQPNNIRPDNIRSANTTPTLRQLMNARQPIPATLTVSISIPVTVSPNDLLNIYLRQPVDPVTGQRSTAPNAIRRSAFIVAQSAANNATPPRP
jgi:hypothetical protein